MFAHGLVPAHATIGAEIVVVVEIEQRVNGDPRDIAVAIVEGVADTVGVDHAGHDDVVHIPVERAQTRLAIQFAAVGAGVGQVGADPQVVPHVPFRAKAAALILLVPDAVGRRGFDRTVAGVEQQDAVSADVPAVHTASGLGEVQVLPVLGVGPPRALIVERELEDVIGTPLQGSEDGVTLVVLDKLAIGATARDQIIGRPGRDLGGRDLTAVRRRRHRLGAIARDPCRAAGKQFLGVGGLQRLDAQGQAQPSGPAEIELVHIAGGTPPARARRIVQLVVIVGPQRPRLDLNTTTAEVQRLDGAHVDDAGHPAFDEVGPLGLVDGDRINEL